MEPLLASTSSASAEAVWRILIAGGLFIVAIIILTLVILRARKSLLQTPSDGDAGGFTLGDLRAMHRRGELSDEEYNRAKDVLIQQVRGSDHAGEAEGEPTKEEFDRAEPESRGDSEARRR